MNILNECSFASLTNIKKIEKHYNAKYVMEACLKGKDGSWLNFPAAIFYTEEAHPQGSNYFALYYNENNELMITNGLSAVENVVFNGLKVNENVIYSRYRHDFRDHGGCFIDGGRDYTRFGGNALNECKIVNFKVKNGNFEFCD